MLSQTFIFITAKQLTLSHYLSGGYGRENVFGMYKAIKFVGNSWWVENFLFIFDMDFPMIVGGRQTDVATKKVLVFKKVVRILNQDLSKVFIFITAKKILFELAVWIFSL